MSEGYKAARKTLKENVGLPHVIAKAHLKKLEHLPPLKNSAGSTLLEFSRHLEVAERTLRGMGPEYVSDLNHTNTLMELNRKLPFFMRGKWAERAGRMIEAGERPKFIDFLKFVKDRARLVNNEVGEDLVLSSSREKKRNDKKGGRPPTKVTVTVTGQNGRQNGARKVFGASRNCPACSGQHGLWNCDKFKKLSWEKRKIGTEQETVSQVSQCRHFKDRCPRETFKCQVLGCVEDHNTLLHPTPREQLERVSATSVSYHNGTPRRAGEGHQQNKA